MADRLDNLISRRTFLRRGSCAALGLGGLASQLFTVRSVQAALAQAGSFPDYKALVCVFLFGGNDNGNTLIPYDGGDQNYDFYASARSNLAIPQDDLAGTIIAPGNTGGRRFALHPSLPALKGLFDSGNLAVVADVGSLVEPVTKAGLESGSATAPPQLFAHNSQQDQWQISTADAVHKIGWGGRVADALQAAGANPDATVSMNISISGSNVLLAGRQVTPYAVSPWGPRELTTWNLAGWGDEQAAIAQAFTDLMTLQESPTYSAHHAMQKAYADITQRAVINSEVVAALLEKPTGITTPLPEDNYLASQLQMVARLIEYAQTDLLHQRQLFLVAMGGYDNHDGLVGDGTNPGPHANLLSEVNDALLYFWDALGELNMRDAVTTFTASDFGRTYVSNGNGSDHGWLAPHLVLGGNQVVGGNLYGTFPDLTIDGPHDTGNGRYIPTTAVDAYAFEMAKWMGVPLSEMSTTFPNVNRFLDINDPATHLGFLS
jgi:uncharacterized protein (DUF1501 family)